MQRSTAPAAVPLRRTAHGATVLPSERPLPAPDGVNLPPSPTPPTPPAPAVQRTPESQPLSQGTPPPPPYTPGPPPPAYDSGGSGDRPPAHSDVEEGGFDPRALTDFQLDELTHRLTGRITRLLRTELRLDRERIGRLRDPR
ncbi:extensin [Streptomyces sp. NPDC048442]|uniref:extensin n=1 Tax=Streptomyces sp. NPDC048442 TaxID=3154823 RepID=UPI00343D927E